METKRVKVTAKFAYNGRLLEIGEVVELPVDIIEQVLHSVIMLDIKTKDSVKLETTELKTKLRTKKK